MPPKKYGKTWEAQPHTLAKIEMLKAYLQAYFRILGQSMHGKPLLYIDGFAGPGEYTNSPIGSPIAALVAVNATMANLADRWKAGNVTCVFIEPDAARSEHLRERITPFKGNSRVTIEVKQKSFEDGMNEIKRERPKPFTSNDPLFVFIDPFGATGVPFKLVADILSSACSEVLINLDADGITRIFKAEGNRKRSEQLTAIFGDESWQTALPQQDSFDVLCQRVLELYKQKLRANLKVRYVFAFEMRGQKGTLNYHLVFASRNSLGLTKMKEAMKTVDQSGNYCFSDGAVGQDLLFRFDQPAIYAHRLHQEFIGREVEYGEMNDFALNETPFINPKSMLRALEEEGALAVKSRNPRRRRGDFNEKGLISVTFLPRKQKNIQQGLFSG